MDKSEINLITALFQCELPVNSSDKNFAVEMAELVAKQPDHHLSDDQRRKLNQVCFKHRKKFPLCYIPGVATDSKSILHWLGPELARAGLIRNECWVPEHCAHAEKIFGDNIAAVMFACLHKYGIDYIQQAPVLLVRSAVSRRYSVDDRLSVAIQINGALVKKPTLRELMAEFSVAYQLRAIHPNNIGSINAHTITELSKLPPSSLAQSIPTDDFQSEWLRFMCAWVGAMLQHNHPNDRLLEWAALRATAGCTHSGVDDFAANADNFNPAWSWRRAVEETLRWHERLRTEPPDLKFERTHGIKLTDQINYGELPTKATEGDYEMVALRSGADLFEEGAKMHHCVFSYANRVISGRSRIYSVRQMGSTVATFELERRSVEVLDGPTPTELLHEAVQSGRQGGEVLVKTKRVHRWEVAQLQGPCNARVNSDIHRAVNAFVKGVNDDIAEQTKRR